MKLVSFGEIMMRLTPPGYNRLRQTSSYAVCYGGAESNVACSYACLGGNAFYVTTLPANELGDAVLQMLRGIGVDVSHIRRGGPRLGVYYLERGTGVRSSQVVYDRAGSSFATAEADTYDWDSALEGADWFFFTGITPALGPQVLRALENALETARRLGVRVACDLNYRSKLWSEAEAGRVMRSLVQSVDLLIANEEHAERILGVPSSVDPGFLGRGYEAEIAGRRENCTRMARFMCEHYPLQSVALTLRTTLSAEETVTGAVYYDGTCAVHSRDYRLYAADRVGAGDAYAAGLLYSLSRGDSSSQANDFAAAACALAHTIPGDVSYVTSEEVERLVRDGSSRIRR